MFWRVGGDIFGTHGSSLFRLQARATSAAMAPASAPESVPMVAPPTNVPCRALCSWKSRLARWGTKWSDFEIHTILFFFYFYFLFHFLTPQAASWSEWGPFSTCPAICGTATITRSRTCIGVCQPHNMPECTLGAVDIGNGTCGSGAPAEWAPWAPVYCIDTGNNTQERLWQRECVPNCYGTCEGNSNLTDVCDWATMYMWAGPLRATATDPPLALFMAYAVGELLAIALQNVDRALFGQVVPVVYNISVARRRRDFAYNSTLTWAADTESEHVWLGYIIEHLPNATSSVTAKALSVQVDANVVATGLGNKVGLRLAPPLVNVEASAAPAGIAPIIAGVIAGVLFVLLLILLIRRRRRPLRKEQLKAIGGMFDVAGSDAAMMTNPAYRPVVEQEADRPKYETIDDEEDENENLPVGRPQLPGSYEEVESGPPQSPKRPTERSWLVGLEEENVAETLQYTATTLTTPSPAEMEETGVVHNNTGYVNVPKADDAAGGRPTLRRHGNMSDAPDVIVASEQSTPEWFREEVTARQNLANVCEPVYDRAMADEKNEEPTSAFANASNTPNGNSVFGSPPASETKSPPTYVNIAQEMAESSPTGGNQGKDASQVVVYADTANGACGAPMLVSLQARDGALRPTYVNVAEELLNSPAPLVSADEEEPIVSAYVDATDPPFDKSVHGPSSPSESKPRQRYQNVADETQDRQGTGIFRPVSVFADEMLEMLGMAAASTTTTSTKDKKSTPRRYVNVSDDATTPPAISLRTTPNGSQPVSPAATSPVPVWSAQVCQHFLCIVATCSTNLTSADAANFFRRSDAPEATDGVYILHPSQSYRDCLVLTVCIGKKIVHDRVRLHLHWGVQRGQDAQWYRSLRAMLASTAVCEHLGVASLCYSTRVQTIVATAFKSYWESGGMTTADLLALAETVSATNRVAAALEMEKAAMPLSVAHLWQLFSGEREVMASISVVEDSQA